MAGLHFSRRNRTHKHCTQLCQACTPGCDEAHLRRGFYLAKTCGRFECPLAHDLRELHLPYTTGRGRISSCCLGDKFVQHWSVISSCNLQRGWEQHLKAKDIHLFFGQKHDQRDRDLIGRYIEAMIRDGARHQIPEQFAGFIWQQHGYDDQKVSWCKSPDFGLREMQMLYRSMVRENQGLRDDTGHPVALISSEDPYCLAIIQRVQRMKEQSARYLVRELSLGHSYLAPPTGQPHAWTCDRLLRSFLPDPCGDSQPPTDCSGTDPGGLRV